MKELKLLKRTNPELYYHTSGKFIYGTGEVLPIVDGYVEFMQDGYLVKHKACLIALRACGIIPDDISLDKLEGSLVCIEEGYKLDNLYYRHKELIESDKKGFFHIPYYEKYLINKNGVIFSTKSAKKLSFSKSKPNVKRNSTGGYLSCRVTTNSGKSSCLLRHRAMALTFLRYDTKPSDLVVNHLNGIPGSDEIDNLKWSTHLDNIMHAIRHGLKKNTVAVLHLDLSTGVETRYPSVQSCAVGIGKDRSFYNSIFYRLRKDKTKIYSDNWLFKLDDGKPWPDINTLTRSRGSNYNPILVKDIFTGKITEYDNASISAVANGLNPDTVTAHLRRNSFYPICGKLYRYRDSAEWPRYHPYQLEIYKRWPKKPKAGVLHYEKGVLKKFYTSSLEARLDLNISRSSMFEKLKEDNNFRVLPIDKELSPDYQKW